MKAFEELTISLSGTTKEEVVEKIGRILPTGWRRGVRAEKNMRKRFIDAGKKYAYNVRAAGLEKATLWIACDESESSVYVSNIIPIEAAQLPYDEYSVILHAFARILSKDPDIKYTISIPETVIPEDFSGDGEWLGD